MLKKHEWNIPSKLNHVNRWSGFTLIGHRSNISSHTFEVTWFTMLICDELGVSPATKLAASEYAMVHDMPEQHSNDVCYPAKRDFPELKKALDNFEDDYYNRWIPQYHPNQFSDLVRFIVKIADAVSVCREINTEISLNTPFEDIQSFKGNGVEIIRNTFDKYEGLVEYGRRLMVAKILESIGIIDNANSFLTPDCPF